MSMTSLPRGPNVFALKMFFVDLTPTESALVQLSSYRHFLERRLRIFEAMKEEVDQVNISSRS